MQERSFQKSILVALLACAPVMAEMDANQKNWLVEAEKHVAQGEANFNTATDGLGTGTPSGAKAKLALVRLGQVKTSIANANIRIEKLPADEARVKELKTRTEALQKAVTDLENAIINPQAPAAPATPAPGAPAAPAAPANPAPAGTKLDYKQEELLKNARFHVRELEGKSAAIQKLAETVSKAEDTNLVPIGQLQAGMNTIEDTHRKEKFADENLAKLPPEGRGVPEVAEQLKAIKESVQASEKVIVPAYDKLVAALDPKNHPAVGDDLKRLSELSAMYAVADIFLTDRARAASVWTQIPQAAKEHDRIVKDYALLMQQETDLGKQLTGTSQHMKEKLIAFIEMGKKQQQSLPGEIDQDLANINKMADQAIAEKKPLFFTGGIPQQLDFAAEKLVLLQALDADVAKTVSEKMDKTRADLKTKQGALSEDIINNNALPNDEYANPDRKKIEELAINAWKKEQPDAEVLKVRIPSNNWKRETMWRYQNSWYFIDRSKLQAQLIIKHNDKLAVIRPINLWIDHTSNDDHTAFPMDGIADELTPQRFMLIGKVK